MGGSSGGGSSIQQTLPPPQLGPSYTEYGNQLESFMGDRSSAFNTYQGPTIAATSPYTQQAVSALANPAAYQQAQGYFGDVAAGNYLGLNPAMQQAVVDPAVQASNAGFNQLGRFGSGINQEQTQEAAMRALMPYYDNERTRQGQAAGMLPGLQQGLGQQLQQAGGLEQQIGQQQIQEAQAQFQQQNYDPQFAALQAYGGLLAPGSQYGTTQTQMPGGSSLASGLGGALTGAALGNSLSAGTWLGAGPASLMGLGPAGWALGGLGLLGGLL